MTLNFNNPSRSFDSSRSSVRFSGYDSIIEVEFFVGVSTLEKIQPLNHADENSYLNTFDKNREQIYAVADKAYRDGKHGRYVYVLKEGDF